MTRISHLAIVVQDLDKAVRLMSEGFGLTLESREDLPGSGMKVVMMKADNMTLELIEPTGPGRYWEFRSLGPASFNRLAFDGDTIPSFEKRSDKLGIRPKKDSVGNADGGSIYDIDPATTLGLRFQMFNRR